MQTAQKIARPTKRQTLDHYQRVIRDMKATLNALDRMTPEERAEELRRALPEIPGTGRP